MTAATVKLPAILDLNAAAPLRSDLLVLRGEPVEIDAGDVQRLGGLCLQVLMSAKATWARDGFAFRLTNLSEAFRENLSLFGMSPTAFEPA